MYRVISCFHCGNCRMLTERYLPHLFISHFGFVFLDLVTEMGKNKNASLINYQLVYKWKTTFCECVLYTYIRI